MAFQLRRTVVECAASGLAVVALAALGALWHLDRTRVWEIPRWDAPGLVQLRAAPSAPVAAETWAVAVNPRCGYCRGSLNRAHDVRAIARAPVRLAVLLVDTPRRPSSATLDAIAADELRWDSAGTWRRRWGHRMYGEILCFDRSDSLVRTLASLADPFATRRALQLGESLRRGARS